MLLKPIQPDPDWIVGKYALMNVVATVNSGKTKIQPLCWRIPFQWQGTHYQNHDDEPYMLLVNSSGGFVEGDVSQFHAKLERGARCLFTTTASSKFYKCLGGETSREIVDIVAEENSLIEYLPDEAIPFENSRVQRINRISLHPTSRLFATDMISAGRVHFGSGEIFKFDSLMSEFQVAIDNQVVALDRINVPAPKDVSALYRLWQGYLHMATVFSYANDLPNHIEDEIFELGECIEGSKLGVSRIENFITVRILSTETWQAHELLYAVWKILRPVIAGKAAQPIMKC